MTFWLLVLLGLFVLWLALAPRTGARAISTRRWLARHIPFIHRANTAQRGQFKQIMMDAALARGAAVGTESSADLKEFAGWLDSLNDKALSNLYKQANAQARQLNLDINWLLDGRAQGKVRQALTDTLLLYTLSIWRARAASPFARLEEYLANPDARGNRQFAQQVYAKLVAKNDAPLSPEMMLASEKQRRKFVNEQIQKTAQENQGEVVVVVQEVLEEQATGKKQGAPQPQEKSTTPSPKTLPPGAAEVSA